VWHSGQIDEAAYCWKEPNPDRQPPRASRQPWHWGNQYQGSPATYSRKIAGRLMYCQFLRNEKLVYCLNSRLPNKSVRKKLMYPGTFILRLVKFSSVPKQRFTHKLWNFQEKVALKAEIEHCHMDSWVCHLNWMNQGKYSR
jgi:hypothetical protein